MSNKEVVTHEQLEKILKGFEKLGAAEREIRNYDKQVKTWVVEWSDRKTLELNKDLGEKLNGLNEQFDGRFRTMLLQSYNNLNTEINAKIAESVEKSAKGISALILDAMKARLAEIKTYAQEVAEIKVNEAEKDLKASAATLKAAIRADLEMFEEKVKTDTDAVLIKNTLSLEAAVKQMVANTLAEETAYVREVINKFTSDLGDILAEKVIDKEAIEQKISEVQSSLANKTQSVINFNIEQARQQMEYAAQAEIKDGIKEASAQIFGAISAN